MNNFIEEYIISEEACDEVLKFFTDKKEFHHRGRAGFGVHLEQKDSYDIGIGYEDIDTMGSYGQELISCGQKYVDTHMNDEWTTGTEIVLSPVNNIQKYMPGGGYRALHYERTGHRNRERELVFMTYLTTTPNAGTAFPQWNYESECIKGKTLIWPAGFTHKHHGIISQEHEKIIVTGWFDWMPKSTNRTTLH